MQKGEEVTPVTPASPDAAGQPQPLVPASAPSQGASGANPAVEPGLTAQGAPRPPHPSTTGQTQPSEEKTELQQKLADLRDLEKVSNKLAELETFTWTTAEQSVLNLQIVLRRKYEGAVLAASVATEEATGVGDTARKAVYAAIVVALVGWFVVVVCVTWLTLNPDPLPFPPIQSVWPALAATSGAVLLLIGIATLTFRFARISHDRAMLHHAEAHQTRRLETAVRLMMIEERFSKTFALKVLNEPGARSVEKAGKPETISALPDVPSGMVEVVKKAVEGLTEVSKHLVELVGALREKK